MSKNKGSNQLYSGRRRRQDDSVSKKVLDTNRRFIDAFSAFTAYFNAEAAEIRRGSQRKTQSKTHQRTNMIDHLSSYPRRIICLTEETTETLYLLGEQERIVGVSGYTVRPPEARLKPKVSAFINAKFDKILALEPDLVFAFSDLQADIAAELIRRGVTVMTFNQRSIAEILEMILTVGRIVGGEEKARALVALLQTELEAIRDSASRFAQRPRVLFEEWYEPLISGICWVEE